MLIVVSSNPSVRSILIKTGECEKAKSFAVYYPDLARPPCPAARGSRSPTVLKIYANRPGGVTFDNTNPPPDGLKPAQEVSLSSSTMPGVIEYPLKVGLSVPLPLSVAHTN